MVSFGKVKVASCLALVLMVSAARGTVAPEESSQGCRYMTMIDGYNQLMQQKDDFDVWGKDLETRYRKNETNPQGLDHTVRLRLDEEKTVFWKQRREWNETTVAILEEIKKNVSDPQFYTS